MINAREIATGAGRMSCSARVSLAVALVLVLGGCREAREKRVAAFMERCSAAKFEREQCIFLLSILDAANDASNDAAMAAAIHATRP